MFAAFAPPYWLISAFSLVAMAAIPVVAFCGAASRPESNSEPGFCGYQCTMTKSITEPHCASTLLFQSGDWPSGQLPGAVNTAPILIVGSMAFIAAANSATFLP